MCALLLQCVVTLAWAAVPTDIMLVLDNSGSMRKNDPEFLLQRAVSGFVNGLNGDTRVGMVVFDEKVVYPVSLAPLDVDTRAALQAALEAIDYRGQLTDSPAAIERAIYELKNDGRADASRVIVFMTDGIVDTGKPGVDTEKTKWLREELAADAADSGIRIFGVAFTENADFFLIQSLAKQTDGAYFRAPTPEDLAGVFTSIKDKLAEPPVAEAPPPPVTPPVPPPTSTTVGGSCLAGLPADERAALEEAAPDSGMSAEELCGQVYAPATGGTGQVTIVRPPPVEEKTAPPKDTDDKLDLVIVAVLAVLVVVGVVVGLLLVRRRGGAPAAGGGAGSAVIPDAFLKDIKSITDEPAIKLGAKPLMIGRVAGNDPAHLDYFVVNKGTVGRRHALIQYRDFCFWLTDQGSVNGTFLNGERIDGEHQLKHGDRIKFHKYEFEFSMPELDDAGHTVFADPNDATMIGEATIIGGPAAAAAAAANAARAPATDVPDFDDDDDDDGTGDENAPDAVVDDDADEDPFDITGAGPAVSVGPIDDEDAFDHDGETAVPESAPASEMDDDLTGGAGDDFDAEASAFFDEDELGMESHAPRVDAFEDDEDELVTAMPLTPPPAAVEEFAESETLLPGTPYTDDEYAATSSEISLDEFMRTDSFEVPGFGGDGDDADDATLMPDDVPSGPVSAPVIEDVFDITGEGTVPPVRGRDDEDDDEDGSEDPTLFRG
ncbi:MAG: VWA domain-containing protein [Gammaproteobacteria bacterium]